jgi:UDPglucose 6-dehydrogenase
MFVPITGSIEWMSVESAEMSKHAINAFLATSITFANEVASICERVGADAKQVERALKSEQRIGPKAYLSPGGAFAGGTLARDINFLSQIGLDKGLPTPLLSSIKTSNDEHKNWARRRLCVKYPSLKNKTVSIWGLTYKPGTDTLRRSLAVELCNWLLDEGANLRVHDPVVSALPSEWDCNVTRCASPKEALKGACALILATEWPEYKEESKNVPDMVGEGFLVIDANRFLRDLALVPSIDYAAGGTPQGTLS